MAIRLEVKIGGLTLRDREVEQLEIAQALGDHHRLSLTFHRDPSKPLQLGDFVAPPVTVSLTDDVAKITVQAFAGIGTSCEEQHQLHGGSRFVLTALSASEKYSRRHHVGRFGAATIGDIVGRFDDVTIGAAPPAKRAANYVQAGEDDLSFLLRLADDHQCFVRPKDKGIEIRNGFDDKRHPLTFGRNLQSVTTRVAAVNPREKGAFYEFRRKEEVLLRDRQQDAAMSGATKITDAVRQKASALNGGKDPNVLESTARMTTIADFRDVLLRESERSLGAAVTIDGVSTNIELTIGDTVDIQAGSTFKLDDAAGTVGLVRLTHRFDGQQYTNSFTATPWMNFDNTVQPPRRIITGLVTAEVTANEDPQNVGRIRVREVGISPDGEDSHFFARLLTPFAGNGRGIAFVPEIGDEVVLGFEEGDPERPFVVGSVWNGKDVSPGPTPKRIVTKSGNQIVMNDAGVIEIFTPGGTCMLQLSNGIDGKPRVTIHSEGNLLLEAKETLQIHCKNLVSTIDEDFRQFVGGDEDTSVSGSRFTQTGGGDIHDSGSRVALLVGGTAIELDATSIVSQSLAISSAAKAQNTVAGMMVQLNPPGFVVPPPSGASFPNTPMIETSWGGRENPKPTERVKVTRDDGPAS
jgi:type VI secretion system secreted protein VgrG